MTSQTRRSRATEPGFSRNHERLGGRVNSSALALLAAPDIQAQFLDAMRVAGVVPVDPEAIIGDGSVHRFRVEGDKPGTRNGWCTLHMDGIPAGAFGTWRGNRCGTWRAGHAPITAVQREQFREQIAAAKRQRDAEIATRQAAAQIRARRLWAQAAPPEDAHPYLVHKHIEAHGIRQLDERLVIPLRDGDGVLWSLEFIGPEGAKRFLAGSRKRGLYFAMGKVADELLIAEGYATGASLYESTGKPVAVAFDCGNLEPVARVLRAKFPGARITLAADNDVTVEGNPGLTHARAAATAVGGSVAIPPAPFCDFNDAANAGGDA